MRRLGYLRDADLPLLLGHEPQHCNRAVEYPYGGSRLPLHAVGIVLRKNSDFDAARLRRRGNLQQCAVFLLHMISPAKMMILWMKRY